MFNRLILAILIPLLATMAALAGTPEKKALKVGDKAPLFILRDADDRMVALHSICGERAMAEKHKVVVLDFFQVTCKPCIEELPAIRKFYAQWKDDERVKFFMVGVGENQQRLKKFRQKHKTEWQLLADSYLVTARNYGVDTFPVAVVIDRQRIVRYIVKNRQENIDELLTRELLKILGKP